MEGECTTAEDATIFISEVCPDICAAMVSEACVRDGSGKPAAVFEPMGWIGEDLQRTARPDLRRDTP